MRVNVYTEELLKAQPFDGGPIAAEIVTADYVSSRTGLSMTNYGLRVYLASAPQLHYVPPRDDDRSAVTFWCGDKKENVFAYLEMLTDLAKHSSQERWRKKVADANEGSLKNLGSGGGA